MSFHGGWRPSFFRMGRLQASVVALLAAQCTCFVIKSQDARYRIEQRHSTFTEHLLAASAVESALEDTPFAIDKSTLESAVEDVKNTVSDPAWRRATELGSIVSGDVLAPVLSSMTTGPKDWDAFWSARSGDLTNADRVTSAIEQMGCTYVKFGQALASRPDIVPDVLAEALQRLQDQMEPFDSTIAKAIIRTELGESAILSVSDLEEFMESLSQEPVAAASIGQVYRGHLRGYGDVAVKVQRPDIRSVVERDAEMLRAGAEWVESLAIPSPSGSKRLIAAKIKDAVDEFMKRIFEELDYRKEAANLKRFASLYSCRHGTSKKVKVVVPELLEDLCTQHVLVMEWIDASKLTDVDMEDEAARAENLALVELGMECTLSQLLDTGVLHADPHSANLIKVRRDDGSVELGYLDFGILSTIPESVRDGLVCAVVQLVFANDVEAVAQMFGQLQLLPSWVIENPEEHRALTAALNETFNQVLVYPELKEGDENASRVPTLRFDKLLGSLAALVSRFEFALPPYFLNNARALATLEGIARELDPSFNVLSVVYPYCVGRLMTNPSVSQVVDTTLLALMRDPETQVFDKVPISKLLRDAASLTGLPRWRVVMDVIGTRGGRRMIRIVLKDVIKSRFMRKSSKPRERLIRSNKNIYLRL